MHTSSIMSQSFRPNRMGEKDCCIVRHFKYMCDVAQWIRENEPIREGSSMASERKESPGENWFQTKNLPEALHLLEHGWDISKEIEDLSSPLFNELSCQIEREDVNYDVNGNYIDIARYADGEPECWGVFSPTLVETKGHSKVLRIVINVGASGGVNSSVMKRKGVLGVTLVKLLEYSGYRCEVWCVDAKIASGYPSNLEHQYWFHIKHPDQYLDEQRMCFAMAHPSFLRRICFAIRERYAPEHKDFWTACGGGDYGYGCSAEVSHEQKGDIYIDSAFMNIQWSSQAAAVEWLKRKLEEQGVHFKNES